MMMTMNAKQSAYDINELYREAQSRWLKPAEVFFILQNHEKYNITQEPAKKPSSGSLFLFNKRVLRFFRRDGHNWRKKKDGRAVGEAHERLKVGNVETLNCYYAHGEDNPSFQRRSYWMLDPAYEHIVLVHYRDITEGNSSSISQSPGSLLSFGQSPSPVTPHNAGSLSVSDYQSLTSPDSIEVSSDTASILYTSEYNNGSISGREAVNHGSAEHKVSHALKKLEEQLSLNDDSFHDFGSSCVQIEGSNNLVDYTTEYFNPVTENLVHDQYLSGYDGLQGGHQFTGQEHAYGRKESLSWEDVLGSCHTSAVDSQPNVISFGGQSEEQQHHQWQNYSGSCADNELRGPNSDDYMVLFDQGQIGEAFESDVSLTVAQKQKFNIQEISPEWGYASEATKVLIIGSFLCDTSESTWHCMFGNIEVPVQVVREGVLSCKAPPLPTGKVTLCITSGNRESCSEVREFEYRSKGSESNLASTDSSNLASTDSTRSPEELLFLVKFIQMLLSDSSTPKKETDGIDYYISVSEALSLGTGNSSSTVDWLLEELLKDKLHHWMSSRSKEQHDPAVCPLSKKDQCILHLVSGLGFEWALSSILNCGVSINFRDIKGWTALHYAAQFGREKMVGALIASGASAGAVTDPSQENPTGETAASIAARSGHKGLAGYLSEVALTSHLTSLTLEESELSKGSAELEAELTLSTVPKPSLTPFEDHVSLKHSLAAVRNATQAAARIQSAFRAHSFRKRQERGGSSWGVDEYGMNADDIHELSAMSRLGYRSPRDHNLAAVSIQKKFRGYKGRKDYLAFRQNVVKLQAYVRGYQVRKHYKVICWAVGILEKVVLRWRRKGSGLRGFRPETESIDELDDEEQEEDILKVFRKQKVDGAINQAISRVLSMVKSSEARQQYYRVLQKFCQKKAELGDSSSEAVTPTGISDFYGVDDVDMYSFP